MLRNADAVGKSSVESVHDYRVKRGLIVIDQVHLVHRQYDVANARAGVTK